MIGLLQSKSGIFHQFIKARQWSGETVQNSRGRKERISYGGVITTRIVGVVCIGEHGVATDPLASHGYGAGLLHCCGDCSRPSPLLVLELCYTMLDLFRKRGIDCDCDLRSFLFRLEPSRVLQVQTVRIWMYENSADGKRDYSCNLQLIFFIFYLHIYENIYINLY